MVIAKSLDMLERFRDLNVMQYFGKPIDRFVFNLTFAYVPIFYADST